MKTRNLRTNRAQLLVDDKDAADLDAVHDAVHAELGEHAAKMIRLYKQRMDSRRRDAEKRGDKRGAAAAREAALHERPKPKEAREAQSAQTTHAPSLSHLSA